MERRIERALADEKCLTRDLMETFGNGPPVLWFERDGLQDQKIERPLGELHSVCSHNVPFPLRQEV